MLLAPPYFFVAFLKDYKDDLEADCETEIAGHWIRNNSDHGALAPSQSYKRKLGEYGSDLQFPRARAPEYSAERERAYLLSSERVQELPRCSGRHIRFQAPESNRFDFPTLDD